MVNKSAVNYDSSNLFQSIFRFWAVTAQFAKGSRRSHTKQIITMYLENCQKYITIVLW